VNVLLIGHEGELNGASRSLLGMIDEFIKKDINVHVLTNYEKSDFFDELKKRKVKIVISKYYRWMIYRPNNNFAWILKKILFLILNTWNLFAILKMIYYVKKNRIDIIHTNSSVVNIGAIISKYSKVAHVFHIREFGEEDFKMYSIYKKERILKLINSNSEKVVAISNAIFLKYKEYFDKGKIELIYNGIPEKFLNKKKIIKKRKYNILLAGRIEEAKGQEEAIIAMNYLKIKGYNNIKLIIAGSGDVKKLEEMIKKYELQEMISIEGYCNNIFELRKNVDFELVCSRNEAFGRVTIEAMMSSNPVIGADTGGTKELIIDGYNGYLYKQGDPVDLSNKVIQIISDHEKFERLGQNSYMYSSEKFTAQINAKKISALYNNIIEKDIKISS
jgi:L-malate glycosyltransferase